MDNYFDIAAQALIELANEEDVDALTELREKINTLLDEIGQ